MPPSRTLVALIAPLALVAAAIPYGGASNAAGAGEVVVAVIDTGVRVNHSEFVYGGTGFAPAGQFVAWWDFSKARSPTSVLPGPGQTWDARWGPYDDNGHGTGTASRVGGKTVSLHPGVKLAIAKVSARDFTGNEGVDTDALSAAYTWAVDTVGADIVSISIGSTIPLTPSAAIFVTTPFDDNVSRAAEKGVLTVVSGGNGLANACGPTFSWAHAYGYSKDALAVGSLGEGASQPVFASCSAFQPDISAAGTGVRVACATSDTCFVKTSGTSFSAPHVAGGAAKLLASSIAGGQDKGARYLRQLVVSCVTDNVWPYATEGAGFFDAHSVQRGLGPAAAGALCPYESSVGGLAQVSQADNRAEGTMARSWRAVHDEWLQVIDNEGFLRFDSKFILPVGPAASGAGVMGSSALGAFEIERYPVTLSAGEGYSAAVSWSPDGLTDVDLYLVPGGLLDPGVYLPGMAVASSAAPADAPESVSYVSPAGGDYTLLVVGWSVAGAVPLTVSASKGGFAGEDLAVGQTVL